MGDPSEHDIRRGSTALIPFVQARKLRLNPENLDLMAYAVLRAVRGEQSFEGILDMAQELVSEDVEAARRMHEAWQRDIDKRNEGDESG